MKLDETGRRLFSFHLFSFFLFFLFLVVRNRKKSWSGHRVGHIGMKELFNELVLWNVLD